jgi:hypothetical protein
MVSSRIYITYCSQRKDDSLKGSGRRVGPDVLYTSRRVQAFIRECRRHGVAWAIFSDHYGVWFPEEKREWYGDDVGDPDRLTDEKFRELVKDFDTKLAHYDRIFFYYNPGRFHRVYRRLLRETALRDKIELITSVYHITA